MSAQVALLGGVILGIDEDSIVRTSRDAGLAPDAPVLVEIDDPVFPLEHRRGRASRHAGRVLALIATGNLKSPPSRRKDADIDVLDIGTMHRKRNIVLRLAGGRTGVAPDTARLVDDLGPLEGKRNRSGSRHQQARSLNAPLEVQLPPPPVIARALSFRQGPKQSRGPPIG